VPTADGAGRAAWEAGGGGGGADIVAIIGRIVPTATVFATEDIRPGGSTPAENFPVKDFDGSATVEYTDFYCRLLPSYAGGGLTIKLAASATSATSGSFVFEAAIRRFADDDLVVVFRGVADGA